MNNRNTTDVSFKLKGETTVISYASNEQAHEEINELNELLESGLLNEYPAEGAPPEVMAEIVESEQRDMGDRLVDRVPEAAALADRLEHNGYQRRAGEWATSEQANDSDLMTLTRAVLHARREKRWEEL